MIMDMIYAYACRFIFLSNIHLALIDLFSMIVHWLDCKNADCKKLLYGDDLERII